MVRHTFIGDQEAVAGGIDRFGQEWKFGRTGIVKHKITTGNNQENIKIAENLPRYYIRRDRIHTRIVSLSAIALREDIYCFARC
jgi:hypothetical protein